MTTTITVHDHTITVMAITTATIITTGPGDLGDKRYLIQESS